MAQSQDGRDTVQEWVHKQKERNQEKKRKENPKKPKKRVRVRVNRNMLVHVAGWAATLRRWLGHGSWAQT